MTRKGSLNPDDRARRAALLRWFRRHRRDLPWRRSRDPYAVWVSEIMLQQTRVETVVPYFERFLKRFPTVRSLARARGASVRAAWSGLGYYRRAQHLKEAAAIVVREHGGTLPEPIEALRSLPGIGAYTAAAISSIAFGRPAAAVDGNVIRVIARWDGRRGRRDESALKRAVTLRAESLAPGPQPGDWTQALMELGATVCLPRDPLCDRCPARRWCRAWRSGHPDRYPEASGTKAPRRERRIMLLVRRGTSVLLVPDPADAGATLAPPSRAVAGPRATESSVRALARKYGVRGEPRGPLRVLRHRTFSHDLCIEIWEATGSLGVAVEGIRWTERRELRRLPVRSPTIKAFKGL